MSQTYTIEAVTNQREWDFNGQKNIDYYVTLKEDDRAGVFITKRPNSDPPKPGEQIAGEFEQRDVGGRTLWKLKPDKKPFGGGGGGGFRPEDPERSRRILRQHSQHMAILWLQAAGMIQSGQATLEALFSLADEFDRDVETAGGQLPPAAQGATPPGADSPNSAARGNGSPYPSVKQLNRAEAIAKSHNITKGEWEQLERVMGFTVAESPDRDSYDRWCDYLERKLPIPNSGSDVPVEAPQLEQAEPVEQF